MPPNRPTRRPFVQQLALLLTSWEATTFLIGEYSESELRGNPVFTVADGLFWLFQQVDRNSVARCSDLPPENSTIWSWSSLVT